MREEEVMAHLHRRFEVADPWRVNANPVTGIGDDLGLIQRHPLMYPIAKSSRDHLGVPAERSHSLR